MKKYIKSTNTANIAASIDNDEWMYDDTYAEFVEMLDDLINDELSKYKDPYGGYKFSEDEVARTVAFEIWPEIDDELYGGMECPNGFDKDTLIEYIKSDYMF